MSRNAICSYLFWIQNSLHTPLEVLPSLKPKITHMFFHKNFTMHTHRFSYFSGNYTYVGV